MRFALFAALALAAPIACGGAKHSPATNAAPSGSEVDAGAVSSASDPSANARSGTDATATSAIAPSGVVDAGAAAPPAPDAHPFAKDAAAAESMIDDAIESRHSAIEKCAGEARQRASDPHARVSLLIGIDQEGSVLGIKTPKGEKKDEKLLVCVRSALKDAPFPKSHSGVITIKKTYEDTIKGQL